jgi:hypothetical protein
MRTSPLALMIAAALLAACAPASLSTDDARAAMKARMERPAARVVKVLEIRSFALTDCADAVGQDGVACTVQMDVGFTVDGAEQRDSGTQRMRFVRASGKWTAHPL